MIYKNLELVSNFQPTYFLELVKKKKVYVQSNENKK